MRRQDDWYYVWCKHVGRVGLYAGIFCFSFSSIRITNEYRHAKIDTWYSLQNRCGNMTNVTSAIDKSKDNNDSDKKQHEKIVFSS